MSVGHRIRFFRFSLILLSAVWSASASANLPNFTTTSLCDARVVALGELPSHGEAAVQEARASITRELVERCGFEQVLFESTAVEFLSLNHGDATQRKLDNALGGFLNSDNLRGFREWLLDRIVQGTLVVGGIDDQVGASAEYSRATLPALVREASGAGECGAAVERNLFWRYDDLAPYDASEKYLLFSCLARSAGRGRTAEGGFAIDALLRLYGREASIDAFGTRDSSMATSALWHVLRDPSPKTIIWAANTHIAKAQGPMGTVPMGHYLSSDLGNAYKAVGFTVLDGESGRLGRDPHPLDPLPPNSLEHRLLKGANGGRSYGAEDALARHAWLSSRILGEIGEADWSQLFDGVVVIPATKAPSYSE